MQKANELEERYRQLSQASERQPLVELPSMPLAIEKSVLPQSADCILLPSFHAPAAEKSASNDNWLQQTLATAATQMSQAPPVVPRSPVRKKRQQSGSCVNFKAQDKAAPSARLERKQQAPGWLADCDLCRM